MVHPMNYFISPKSKNQGKVYNIYNKGNNIAEDSNVLSFVRTKFHERYTKNGKDFFQEFLDLVFPFEDIVRENGDTELNLVYSPEDLTPILKNILEDNKKSDKNESLQLDNRNTEKKCQETKISQSTDLELQLAKEFLCNPNTSFRKLEKGIMNIDSPARGGGYKAKTIINGLGLTIEKKECYFTKT